MLSMSNQNRVNAGVPTGGQFAAHERADGTVDLAAAWTQVVEEESEVRARVSLIAAKLIADGVRDEFPNAATVRLHESDQPGGTWHGGTVLDADGEELDEFGEVLEDYFDQVYSIPTGVPTTLRQLPGGGYEQDPDPRYDWLTIDQPSGRNGDRFAVIDLNKITEAAL